MKNTLLISSIALLIAGCSVGDFKEIPYGCDTDESDPYCASVEEIYKAASTNAHRNVNVLADDKEIKKAEPLNSIQSQIVKGGDEDATQHSSKAQIAQGPTSLNRIDNNLEGRPVYTPERVHRIYRGPWQDADGILHSGEHLYYRTEGRWSYGSLKNPGSATGLLTPVSPTDLGFSQGVDTGTQEATRVGRHLITTEDNLKK